MKNLNLGFENFEKSIEKIKRLPLGAFYKMVCRQDWCPPWVLFRGRFCSVHLPQTATGIVADTFKTDENLVASKRHFFDDVLSVFPYIRPLARPNIAEKGAGIVEKARLRDGFGKPLIL